MVTDFRAICEAPVDDRNSTLVEKYVTCAKCVRLLRRNEELAAGQD
jgi:hypothetical protein